MQMKRKGSYRHDGDADNKYDDDDDEDEERARVAHLVNEICCM